MDNNSKNKIIRTARVVVVLALFALGIFGVYSWILNSKPANASGWLTGWSYRKQITISNSNVDGDLSNFPLLVNIAESGGGSTNIGYNVSDATHGYDIRFTDSDGTTLLAYERESFSVASSNLTANFWVKVPGITHASGATIYVYYGNSGQSGSDWTTTGSPTQAHSVWSNGYVGVWHLGEDPTGSAPQFIDSTPNTNDMTVSGYVDTISSVPGKIGNGWSDLWPGQYNGNGSSTSTNPSGMGTGNQSISIWIKLDSINSTDNGASSIFGRGAGSYPYSLFALKHLDNGELRGIWGSDGQTSTGGSILSTGTWYYLVLDLAGTSVKTYLNGDVDTTTTKSQTIYDNSTVTVSNPMYYGASGIFDEARISSASRPAEWIKFEYHNQADAGNDLSFAGQETAPAPSGPSTVGNGIKIGGGIQINNEYVPSAPSWACGNTLTDSRDSKAYATVLIGTQCWMAANLNVGTRTDGLGDQGTSCSSIQKYCYGDDDANCSTYGGIYQWNQAMCGLTTPGGQGICPDGWHIPTNDEFTTLERTICVAGGTDSGTCDTTFPMDTSATGWRGTDANEGANLKTIDTSHFSALLGGGLLPVNTFFNINTNAYFWTSLASGNSAWDRYLGDVVNTVGRNTALKRFGYSVRCLKN